MRESYLAADFRRTARKRFPGQAEGLNAAFDVRLRTLWAESAGESRAKRRHLKSQILPGIAAYETLRTVLPQEEALRTVHGYLEAYAGRAHRLIAGLLCIPGLYRLVPGVFVLSTRTAFGAGAGFTVKELRTDRRTWQVDMLKCPYHDTCVRYGCPELCRCFCDSDDISYAGLHPRLLWRRTKTLGRGDDRCDFCLKISE